VTSRPVLIAFVAFVLLAGSNAAAVKVVLGELPPLWSAGLRFAIAGGLLLVVMLAQHRPVPRGDHLRGTILFGVIGFGLVYFFLYQAIPNTGSGTTMTVLSVVPLLTVLLSAVHGIERPRLLGVVGALVASAGVVLIALDELTLSVPLLAILLLLAGATCQAEGVVVVKRWPPGDPVAANAIAMGLGGALLLTAGLVTGEPVVVPTQIDTLVAMAYLIVPGSVVVFMLALYVLARWTASATSYAFLLFPIVAITLGVILFDEPFQPLFLVGGAVVLLGVYIGAFYRPKAASEEQLAEPAAADTAG
jgi:drug/metabolite transporter (DMT)-like permease